jgi:anhydro-N-acetylmuramic acid kinase
MRVIGLMSGTSVDGIDAALVDLSGSVHDLQVDWVAGQTTAYPPSLREQVLAVGAGEPLTMETLAELDDRIALEFAQAAIALQAHHAPAALIGSHGQTVFHRPPAAATAPSPLRLGYSLQLGRGAVIAHHTGLPTITNFRAADIAAGGQGAPLVPPVDRALLSHPTYNRCVQNIGGIGNVAYLPATAGATPPSPMSSPRSAPIAADAPTILGWDTGPGNMLLDLAVHHLSKGQQTYDHDGLWAAQGTPQTELVDQWLTDPFIQQAPPKSTGREYYGFPYLQRCCADADAYGLSSADLLATLTDFTAATIAYNYRTFLPQLPDQVLVCGGGSKNPTLLRRLQQHLLTVTILTTDAVGLSADYKEAIAFAVLAYWRQQGIPGNLPAVTGARATVLLGDVHRPVS